MENWIHCKWSTSCVVCIPDYTCSVSMLSWQVKNVSNSVILHAIIVGLALINCAHGRACHA